MDAVEQSNQTEYNPISNFHHYLLFPSAALSPIAEILGGVDEMSPYEMEQHLDLHAPSVLAHGDGVWPYNQIFLIFLHLWWSVLVWYHHNAVCNLCDGDRNAWMLAACLQLHTFYQIVKYKQIKNTGSGAF